jgi:hypothetical protein
MGANLVKSVCFAQNTHTYIWFHAGFKMGSNEQINFQNKEMYGEHLYVTPPRFPQFLCPDAILILFNKASASLTSIAC